MHNDRFNPIDHDEKTANQSTSTIACAKTGCTEHVFPNNADHIDPASRQLWEGKPWHGLSYELKQIFGKKTVKLSLDGGFTCPNRDGTLGTAGCSFCSEDGSGSHNREVGIGLTEQISRQQDLLSKKWPNAGYIAYFQNFTGTYGIPEELDKCYFEALNTPGIVGLAIATRPDCLGPEVLALLERLQGKTFLWIELGLQTVHNTTAEAFGRGYDYACFLKAFAALKQRQIPTVIHLINGLPGETLDMMRQSAREISLLRPWGVKLHLLHVIKGTRLAQAWEDGSYIPLTMAEYVGLIADQLVMMPEATTIHRLTGDGAANTLLAPDWSRNKKGVLGAIEGEMKRQNIWQGKAYNADNRE